MAFSTIKDFIEELRDQGDLLSISTPLDPKFEISTILSGLGKKESPAFLFEKVRGYKLPVIGNLLGTKKRLSMALGIDSGRFFEGVLLKLDKRISPVLTSDPSPKEVITTRGKIDLLKLLPILTHYDKDSGPYITSGLTSARDPEKRFVGRGLHRMEVRGENRLGVSLLNPPLSDIYARYKKENKRMDVATVIGADPLVLISSILKVPIGTDKLSLAGGLKGEPIPLIKARTVDIDIPQAEITIEGFIDPSGKEEDGVLGESSGYYMGFPKSPTIQVTAVTCRKNALYHAIVPWSLEVDNLLYLVHGIDFIPKMKREIPAIQKVHFIPKTFGAHVVMSIDTDNKGEIRRALTLALFFTNVKKAIVVDVDVDPEDDQEVEWAIATRFQGDRDLILIPNLRGQPIDPSSKEGFLTTKLGIDATRPKKEGFVKVDVPEKVKKRMSPLLKNLQWRGKT
ncbi:MAG: UbiD family decarboxylase [Thermodesulfobacteriota bacterium]|nr:UbiD family decarboxylase [Thermodesulfobacteriota bacterium]